MTETTTTKKNYKPTLNLPKTAFAMKANLVQNEPQSQKRWEEQNLYSRILEAREGGPRFVFHDGPPYTSGHIHLGQLLNKVLKDLVVRSRTMSGCACPYIPGWDCHGLPIEHKVMQEFVSKGKMDKINSLSEDDRRMVIRRECQKYANKYMKLQREEMKRLLTLADYDHPYLTMTPDYEHGVLDVFADLVGKGLVYRALKSVHWSIENETALAEAELEYYDREDLSVYVDFEAADKDEVAKAFDLEELDETPSFMIWTTTPWTLAANLAIAVHERFEYALVRADGGLTILAKELVEKVTAVAESEDVEVLATTRGDRLIGLQYRHPFMTFPEDGAFVLDMSNPESVRNAVAWGAYVKRSGALEPNQEMMTKVFRIVSAEYVTLEDGTGLVHTAPGHGADDYNTGKKLGLPIYCPVRPDGCYDKTLPEWLSGMSIWDANEKVTDHLRDSGHLFYSHRFTHSYPHDWRGKTPVIFRATDQWFIGVDRGFVLPDEPDFAGLSLRYRALHAVGFDLSQPQTKLQEAQAAILKHAEPCTTAPMAALTPKSEAIAEAIEKVTYQEPIRFIPEWGRNRMRGMLESRPDWCLSRQRSWGLPIPAFQTEDGEVFLTAASVRAVARVVAEKGSDAWFTESVEELLKEYDPSDDPDLPDALHSSLVTRNSSLQKMYDIFDVWFESGTSWNAVMRQREQGYPIDLYLEGSDQHRGWFQTSLLPALGATGQPPYRAVLTHGFVVDKDGRKMSKSGDNAISVSTLLAEYGADICRWWVSSIATENDIKADMAFFDRAGESYRKVRNTIRFLLSNLNDFVPCTKENPDGHCVDLNLIPKESVDAWALAMAARLNHEAREAYDSYDFKRAHQLIYDFCNDTMSAVYCAAVKDRLYCDTAASQRRRITQTVMWDILEVLTRLLAPIVPHTADETYRALWKDESTTVHTQTFFDLDFTCDGDWPAVLAMRDRSLKAIEDAKNAGIENPLDAGLSVPDPDGVVGRFAEDFADLCGVSRVTFSTEGAADVAVSDLREESRCGRCWKRTPDTTDRGGTEMLCNRCADAIA